MNRSSTSVTWACFNVVVDGKSVLVSFTRKPKGYDVVVWAPFKRGKLCYWFNSTRKIRFSDAVEYAHMYLNFREATGKKLSQTI